VFYAKICLESGVKAHLYWVFDVGLCCGCIFGLWFSEGTREGKKYRLQLRVLIRLIDDKRFKLLKVQQN
jgi:hypothetical protein